MLIDTHCHLNFKAFKDKEELVVKQAQKAGVNIFIVPGADLKSSQRAIDVATKFPFVYAAVGIHPHHILIEPNSLKEDIEVLKKMLSDEKVVAVGEVGMDRYEYQQTKYEFPQITPELVKLQEKALIEQIKLAIEFNKSIILHNRLAIDDILPVLVENWDTKLENRTVFHCCEADEQLLDFAMKHKVYIGIDGDISWSRKKQRFIKEVPLERLVLETDSPYLKPKNNTNWPESLEFPENLEKEEANEPKNIALICDLVAYFKNLESIEIEKQTTENGLNLFRLNG